MVLGAPIFKHFRVKGYYLYFSDSNKATLLQKTASISEEIMQALNMLNSFSHFFPVLTLSRLK